MFENAIVNLSTDTIVNEGLLRTFRNAVVQHIRESMNTAYGEDASARLRRPFKAEEWEAAERSAEAAKTLGYVSREHIDDFDYLGVNHLHNVFDQDFGVLLPGDRLPPSELEGKFKQQFLSWLREIKGFRDPLAHPPDEDMSPVDAARVIDSARRVVNSLGLASASEQLTLAYTELIERAARATAPDPLEGEIDDTLPPAEAIVVDFVGRHAELASLWDWLLGADANRWMLSGDGGKGKSAIAYAFASDVRRTKPAGLSGVYWLSAKRRRFEEGAIVEMRSPDFADLESAFDHLLVDFGWREEVGKPVDVKRRTLLELLEQFPSLIVVDDLDSIPPEHEDVVEFFTLDAPRSNSKVLLTSRRLFAGMGRTCTTVSGLEGEEAASFIRSRAQRMQLPEDLLNQSQSGQIAALCEGFPLYMEDFLRLCKFLPFADALQAWRSSAGDEARGSAPALVDS